MGNFETVTIWDKAIDVAKSDLAAFIDSRDMSKLKFRDNQHPTTYVLRDIPNALAVRHLFSDNAVDMRRMLAFQMSVIAIKNVTLRDGRTLHEWRPRAVAESDTGVSPSAAFLVSTEEVNELFHLANVLDVGEVAHARSFLPPEIGAGFLLPPTSRQIVAASQQLFAELVANMGTDTDVASEQAPQALSSDEPSADRGDAHATATAPPS
mgnify:CR=1 FL=1